ncbi:MAG: hypothetical protein KTQ49_03145 [Candidatus Omnitrophica bacterium]|nr:hypothetical protein [Candidatus Omnitrophota bacterium]
MISAALLSILCCPETKQGLVEAGPAWVEKLNQLIAQRKLKDRSGKIVEHPLDTGLVREDKKFLYPVRSDIPVMLPDEAIPLEGLF